VVFNKRNEAIYFSKRLIPYVPPNAPDPAEHVHLHLGIYAYRRKALAQYAAASPSLIEMMEGLEQIRFLAEGHVVKVVPRDPVGWDCIELNNPTDVEPIEAILRQRGIE
jgi:3-deoxy-manno-octulosonate cytidylyltransferase (CMP-KDO synthetase)